MSCTYQTLPGSVLTINVPVVFMARYVMILNGTHYVPRHKNNRYIGSFMYPSSVVVCCLLCVVVCCCVLEGCVGLLESVLCEDVFRG